MPGPQSKQRSEHSDALTALSPEQSRRQLRCCFGPIIHRKTGASGEHLTVWRLVLLSRPLTFAPPVVPLYVKTMSWEGLVPDRSGSEPACPTKEGAGGCGRPGASAGVGWGATMVVSHPATRGKQQWADRVARPENRLE